MLKTHQMTESKVVIVVAWAEQTKLTPTGRNVMRDLNWFPEFLVDWEGRAAIWINRGTVDDVCKAKEWASKETDRTITVYTYPTSERDPLGKAREAARRAAA